MIVMAIVACNGDDKAIFDQFTSIQSVWSRKDKKEFVFQVEDTTIYYDLKLQMRIQGSYPYSNIWVLYEIEGGGKMEKGRTMIPLSDQQTGKWLGSGGGNLIGYQHLFKKMVKLGRGTYKVRFTQNMMDEELSGLSDVGLRVERANKVF